MYSLPCVPQDRMQRGALIDSFWGFSSSTVEPRHLELARACIEVGENRYDVLPFEDLLNRNRVSLCVCVCCLRSVCICVRYVYMCTVCVCPSRCVY